MESSGRETGNSSEEEIFTIDKKGIGNSGDTEIWTSMKQKMGTLVEKGTCTSHETVKLRNGGREIWKNMERWCTRTLTN